MLVLTRKQGQGFLLGEDVEITLLEINGDQIRIAIKAPKNLRILRKELAETRTSNQEAVLDALPRAGDLSELKTLLLNHEGDDAGSRSNAGNQNRPSDANHQNRPSDADHRNGENKSKSQDK